MHLATQDVYHLNYKNWNTEFHFLKNMILIQDKQ
jgi:hypothetical protein